MRKCAHCKKRMRRQRYQGVLESMIGFSRRKFCNRSCMAEWMTGRIKVMNDRNSRRQSGRAVRSACQLCGTDRRRLHVHHRDENPQNNRPSNLLTLCVSCHRRCHSPNYDPMTGQRRPCLHCSNQAIKRGLCSTHLSRLRRFGHPLAKKFKIGSGWVLSVSGVSPSARSRSVRSRDLEDYEGTATRSSRNSPPNSSKPRSKRSKTSKTKTGEIPVLATGNKPCDKENS